MSSCHHNNPANCVLNVPIFAHLSESEILDIINITNTTKLSKGQQLYGMGDKLDVLYVIHTGKIRISRINANGKQQVLKVLGANDFLGELSLFGNTEVNEYAEVIEDVTMCTIEATDLKKIMEQYPSIAFKILQVLSSRLDHAENTLERITLNTVPARIASSLLELAQDQQVHLPMSKGDFANSLGMSQESLSRQLSEFVDYGWIQLVGHRKIIILDPDSLEDIQYE